MTTFQIIIRKFWIYVEKPIWSFIVNCCYWLGHLNKIGEVRKIKTDLKCLSIKTLMEKFVWKEDSFKDWTPWVMTIICQSFKDDCDGAAVLAKWWFTEHGIEAEILNLYSATEGHTICVTNDHTKFVSNDRVVPINPISWYEDIMEYFGGKYEVMI